MLATTIDHQRDTVVKFFGRDILSLPGDPVDLCLSLCRIYDLTPETLFYKWEAFATSLSINDAANSNSSLPTRSNLEKLRAVIAKEAERVRADRLGSATGIMGPGSAKTARIKQHATQQSGFHDIDSLEGFLQGIGLPVTPRAALRGPAGGPMSSPSTYGRFQTPTRKSGKVFNMSNDPFTSSPLGNATPGSSYSGKSLGTQRVISGDFGSPSAPSPNSLRFAERSNKNKCEEVLNSQLPPASMTMRSKSRKLEITLVPHQQTEPYRYMFEKISDKSEVLDDRIDAVAQIIQGHYQIEEFAHPACRSQTPITTIGRICCDSEARLNDQSVVLESSRSLGGGCRVKLNLNSLNSFAVFPGQILGVEGMNSSGECITASRLLPLPLLPMPTSTPSSLLNIYHAKNSEAPLNGFIKSGSASAVMVTVASGPYTFEDNLEFEPLKELIREMENAAPDVLIMTGPFISQDHPLIRAGDLELTPRELFSVTISSLLQSFLAACPNSNVILIPSCADVVHEWCSMPQPPLDKTGLGLPKQVVCFPNPVQFSINEMVFAVTSTDVLFHLGREEAARAPALSDRLGRLARHVLEQRSFYPMFPSALGEGNVDYGHLEQLELQATPDVLILTSQLKYFAKEIEQVVIVNPGQLTKRQSGGTYAVLTVHPPREDDLEALMKGRSNDPDTDMDGVKQEELDVRHEIAGRTRVEIQRV